MELKDEDDYVDIAALFIDLSVLKLNEPVFAVFAELLVLHWDFVFSAVSEISFNFCLYHFGLLLFCFLNFFLVLLSVVISVVITLSFSCFCKHTSKNQALKSLCKKLKIENCFGREKLSLSQKSRSAAQY